MPKALASTNPEKLKGITIRMLPEEARTLVSAISTPGASISENLAFLNAHASLGRIGHRTSATGREGIIGGASVSLISQESPEIQATFCLDRVGKGSYVPGGLGVINRYGALPKMLWDVPEGHGLVVRIHYTQMDQSARPDPAWVLVS